MVQLRLLLGRLYYQWPGKLDGKLTRFSASQRLERRLVIASLGLVDDVVDVLFVQLSSSHDVGVVLSSTRRILYI